MTEDTVLSKHPRGIDTQGLHDPACSKLSKDITLALTDMPLHPQWKEGVQSWLTLARWEAARLAGDLLIAQHSRTHLSGLTLFVSR